MASELHQRQRHAKYEADVEMESEERRDERVVRFARRSLLRAPSISGLPKLGDLDMGASLAMSLHGGVQWLGQRFAQCRNGVGEFLTRVTGNTQAAVNYMLSEISVFDLDFPSDSSSIKFRAVQWIATEVMLALAAIWNLLPRQPAFNHPPSYENYTFADSHIARYFRWIFYLSTGSVLLDFILNLVWLPIATSKTYGFRSAHDAFMTTYNGTGAPAGWNWCLSYLATAGILIGFDASGHVAEETKNASLSAARGIFWSTVASGLGGFAVVILFLFCVNTAIAILAASRLVFAVARDGVLPFSPWVAKMVNGQPRNAVLVVWGTASIITCTILPSAVAFTSLVSAAGVPSAAAYGLICLGRLFLTPKKFPKPAWSLGRLSKPFQAIAVLWNGWVVAVLYSPYVFPVTADTLNYAPVIMGIVTIFAILSWWFIPSEKWLPSKRIQETLDAGESSESIT
ncbi:Thiamine transporter thi9 [Beauveria bassiana]|uniref:Thiamine transporter thi9 n=1 Tax=Beauveria bassiana TaxID=176275 RepID=A0A2N6NDC1_BEABA|nr:Thiamine transporter thi9 [Beauveria bassiana]